MQYRQLNLSIPESVYKELKHWIPQGKITDFVLGLTTAGLQQLRFKKATEDTYGAWSKEAHPELSRGAETYIRRLRRGRKF